MANRFEQVDEIQPDAITLTLGQHEDRYWGSVHCPATAFPPEAGATDMDSGELPILEALSGAIKLANEIKLALVVVDPDGLWRPQWGELYRWEDEAGGADA